MSNAPNSDVQSDVRAGGTTATPAPTPLDVEAEGADGNQGEESPDTRDGTLISFGMPLEACHVLVPLSLLCSPSAEHDPCIGCDPARTLMMGSFETSMENPTGGVVYRTNRLWADMASLIIELSIPMAGYLGALYHNRQLTCCFCSCNLFLVFASSWTFMTLAFRQRELAGKCDLEAEEQNRALCYMWVFIGDVICSVILSCCAAMASIRLFHKLSREPPNIESTPVVGEAQRENHLLGTFFDFNMGGATASTLAENKMDDAGWEVALYSIDRASNVLTPPADGTPTPVRASVPRASIASTLPRASVRIELAPVEVAEDEY
eukprot:s370_g24.t1